MLVFDAGQDGFADHADPQRRYRLPTALRPHVGDDGRPSVLLSRGDAGGTLQIRLETDRLVLGPNERPAPIAESRFRLVMKTGGAEEAGAWRTSAVLAQTLVDRSVSLNAVEAAIARRLGAAGSELVDVEVEATVHGFAPTHPWAASVFGSRLRDALSPLLGRDPVPWSRVEDAFFGLGADLFTWRALEPGAIPPPPEALRALARHAAPHLLQSDASGWSLRGDTPSKLTISLAVPVAASRTFGLRWSFSDFLASQPDLSRHLIDVKVPAPFEAAEIVIGNDTPLAPAGISALEIEVRTGGPTGSVRHTFLPGAPSATRLRYVRETFDESALSWRAKVTVVTASGTAIIETGFRNCEQSIQVRAEDLGLTPLRFFAEPEVFEHAESVECAVGSRKIKLTASAPEAWAVGRTPPATVEVSAAAPGGTSVALGAFPVDGGLIISASMLGVGEVMPVRLSVNTQHRARAAYVAVQPEGGPWRTLEAGAPLDWPVRRASLLVPPRLRYKTRHVPKTPDGRTQPIVESLVRDAEGETVEVKI
ncbi:MAG: hypothetical protein AB7U75_22450 [Hyphomicrobiaceae bacterium]|nr:hypothetical protein [Nitrospirales bacterium]